MATKGGNIRLSDDKVKTAIRLNISVDLFRKNITRIQFDKKQNYIEFAIEQNKLQYVEPLIQLGFIDKENDYFQCAINNPLCIKILLQNGLSLYTIPKFGMPFIISAIKLGKTEVVKESLEAGFNPNMIYITGRWSILMFACSNQQKEIVDLLIDNGADVNYYSNDNTTPVFLSCKSPEILKKLIFEGANVNRHPNYYGNTIFYCIANNLEESLNIILDAGCIIRPENIDNGIYLIDTIKKKFSIETIKKLINACANVNHVDSSRNSPLYQAYLNKDYILAEILLSKGAIFHDERDGYFLIQAIKDNEFNHCISMIKSKANVNYIDDDKKTPLIYACEKEAVELVEFLVLNKAIICYSAFTISKNIRIHEILNK